MLMPVYLPDGGNEMSASLLNPSMTTEELFALPDDGVDRELICGELRERPMTRRHQNHSRVLARVVFVLEAWLLGQPEPRGRVYCGEAGVRLRRNPETTVGIDAVYVSAAVVAVSQGLAWIEGLPTLAVEILSPSDKHEDIVEKVRLYLEAGIPLVWIIDPELQTVAVYRPDALPVSFNTGQELSAEPHLPGFRVGVASLFE
jgi:Uma2 family endonuclease